jgi:hypothetical protein
MSMIFSADECEAALEAVERLVVAKFQHIRVWLKEQIKASAPRLSYSG